MDMNLEYFVTLVVGKQPLCQEFETEPAATHENFGFGCGNKAVSLIAN